MMSGCYSGAAKRHCLISEINVVGLWAISALHIYIFCLFVCVMTCEPNYNFVAKVKIVANI